MIFIRYWIALSSAICFTLPESSQQENTRPPATDEILLNLNQNCFQVRKSVYTPSCPYGNFIDDDDGDDGDSLQQSNCQSMDIFTGFEYQRLIYIDDTNENVEILAQFTIQWAVQCPHFRSNFTDWTLAIGEQDWWTPSLFHVNAVDDQKMANKGSQFYVMRRKVDEPGVIQFKWQKIGTFSSHCYLNLDMFPFDRQICQIRIFLKENIKTGRLQVIPNSNSYSIGNMQPLKCNMMSLTATWACVKASAASTYEVIYGSNQSLVAFKNEFKRKPDFYTFNFILPCFLLNSLSLASFALDVSDANRLMFAVTLLLALTVMHTDISQYVPPTPHRNLLSNYADFGILHSWITTSYFAIMIFLYGNNFTIIKHNYKLIEMVAIIWFIFQVSAINLYLIIMSTNTNLHSSRVIPEKEITG